MGDPDVLSALVEVCETWRSRDDARPWCKRCGAEWDGEHVASCFVGRGLKVARAAKAPPLVEALATAGGWGDWPTGPGLWWCRRTDTMETFICYASADSDAHGEIYMRGLVWEDGSPANALHKPSKGWVFAQASPEITYDEALEVIRNG